MVVEKIIMKSCCGKTVTILKFDKTVSKDWIQFFTKNGFIETQHFTNSGILYVESLSLIISTPFGSDRLSINCRKSDCIKEINELESLLKNK